ncbi:FMN-binding negative transcriptional regulator [Qipengyuania sp. SS22]|uniref:FMN-binding negative transcriptional regulator n=1 Tax=Qipengyuania sp. SS22 TaxID=2979461 RepID=UPI0021E52D09|nr:FMN-binding negative transcriptional regulator [Qipengyuania sp. SS22]UYH55161.1 FMN-binding negative transcriptional regulator [Qipengyuania sp. SS22]
MHPNPLFRSDDRQAIEAMIAQVGVGTVFLQTPAAPRAARTPLVMGGKNRIQFHLAKANALFDHLDGASTLVTVDGPGGYISPRWYANRDTVPTWNYVAVEAVGIVRRMADDELETFLHRLIAMQEARLGGDRWSADEASEAVWQRLFGGIGGFELAVEEYRPTIKLSQDKPAPVREAIAAGVERAGNGDLAGAMRGLPA